MRQYDDYETSTRVCLCGASVTWAGADNRLQAWMTIHQVHDRHPLTRIITSDGLRAGSPEAHVYGICPY